MASRMITRPISNAIATFVSEANMTRLSAALHSERVASREMMLRADDGTILLPLAPAVSVPEDRDHCVQRAKCSQRMHYLVRTKLGHICIILEITSTVFEIKFSRHFLLYALLWQ